MVYRYASRLAEGFEQAGFPQKIEIQWTYEGAKGMPSPEERARMDQLEDLLAPVVEESSLAVLAMVSTGEDMRTWVYYTRSSEEFMGKLNIALSSEAAFPIEIELSDEPGWGEYKRFFSDLVPADGR